MSSEVKKYSWHVDAGCMVEEVDGAYVESEDYAALEAECERLREANRVQLEMAAVHGEAAARVIRERDALRAQLEAIRAAGGEEPIVVACRVESDDSSGLCWKSDLPYLGQSSYSEVVPLMTVAQHSRIVAAMAAELEKLRKDAGAEMFLTLSGEIAKLQAALEREKDRYQRDVYGLNNEGDPIGGEPAGGYANDNARLRAELAAIREQSPIGETCLGHQAGVIFYTHLPYPADGTKLYAMPPLAGKVSVPDVLFDGHAVYTESCRLRAIKGGNARTSPENVSDTLDAVVSLLRGQQAEVKP